MPVREPDGGVSEPLGDLLRVGTLSDEQARAGVSEIVEPERCEAGAANSRPEVSPVEVAAQARPRPPRTGGPRGPLVFSLSGLSSRPPTKAGASIAEAPARIVP